MERKKRFELDLDLNPKPLFSPEEESALFSVLEKDEDILIPLSVVRNRKLPANAKLMYGVLRSFCWKKERTCEVSLVKIAEKADTWFSSVPKLLKSLEQEEYISVDRAGRRNVYRFLKP